jgi:hypothetical protein
MSLELFLYLVSVLYNVSGLCAILFVIGIISMVIYGCIYIFNFDEFYGEDEIKFKNNTVKVIKTISVAMAIMVPFSVLIPSKKTMYAIGFSHYAKQTQIPQKLLDLLNQKLDDALGGEKL